jgi:hypothetical protein
VFFDSNSPSALPWNTTKTGVDTDSPLWRSVQAEMLKLMRPIITFLNAVKNEKDAKPDFMG